MRHAYKTVKLNSSPVLVGVTGVSDQVIVHVRLRKIQLIVVSRVDLSRFLKKLNLV